MKLRILFIINPVSGVGKQKTLEQLVPEILNTNEGVNPYFDYQFAYTQCVGHAIEIARDAAVNFDIIVAVGGDGTVNEICQGLRGTNKAIAIIPTGSGNGLARHLKIPIDIKKAIGIINNYHIETIDTANINQYLFVNIAGIGFDAHIGHKFSNTKHRGFWSYMKITLQEYWNYKPLKYKVKIDGKVYKKKRKKYFLISFANSSQYGNNAYISPDAQINDGLIDVCFLKPFPAIAALMMGLRLFLKTMDQSVLVTIVRAKEIEVESKKPLEAHIDGEPIMFGKKIRITINHNALKVLVP